MTEPTDPQPTPEPESLPDEPTDQAAPEPLPASVPAPAPAATGPAATEVAVAVPAPVPAAEPAVEPAKGSPSSGRTRRRIRRRWLVLGVVALGLVVAAGAGLAWYFSPQPLLPEATAALASTPAATYANEPTGLTFRAKGAPPTTGLILYPGAKVPAEAYAPTARAIAEQGYLVVVVPMPLNFAIFNVGAADGVMAAHPEITTWAIGGHSLGGAMAAQYTADHDAAIAGLALCGAYSASDLSAADILASSVYGSLDAAAPKIEDPATQALLPATTAYDRIEGGNHEQCGWYTGQPNDPPATITREDQQVRIVEAWVALLRTISAAP